MKRLWIAVVLLCGVLGLCVGSTLYRHRQMDIMIAALDRMETAYTLGDIPRARELAEEIVDRYDRVSRVALCFIAHSDMAESQETVRLLTALLRQDGDEELRMEVARLREELSHLREIDDPLFWNIL